MMPKKKWDVGERVEFKRGGRMRLPAHRHLNNPPLMTFMANPPSARMQMQGNLVPYTGIRYFKNDPISRECHAILYTHAENGEDFKHEFGPDVKLYPAVTATGKHVVIIEGDDDIWDDYPE
jgi:hypothetical protein